jgi:hypothetical protein
MTSAGLRGAGHVDRERLDVLLGGEEVAWLRDRVRQRIEQGAPITGSVRLTDPSPAQREAVDRLMGRRPSAGATVSVSLDAVDRMLHDAGVCDDLAAAVTVLDGPIDDRRARHLATEAAWRRAISDAQDAAGARWDEVPTWAESWLDDLVATGLLRRLAVDPTHAGDLLSQAVAVLAALPANGVTTAGLAARVLGDSHALDDRRSLSTVVLKGLWHRGGGPDLDALPTGVQRRTLWATVGVASDMLSSTVLVLGLGGGAQTFAERGSTKVGRLADAPLPTAQGWRRRTGTLTDTTLRAHADVGEPLRLTLSQLTRHPPRLADIEGTTVFACENPAIVAAASRRLGVGCAPLVCVEGQPSAAAQMLLRQLADAGARVAYHGDFDWAGLRIAHLVLDRFGARPWRFGRADYLAAPAGPPLEGQLTAASWDPALPAAMVDRGVAVHEEQVVDDLLDDLA